MEDLKKIQEFFSKPLEEGKQLDIVDFAKVVKAVEQTGHPVTVLLVPKFNEIEVITGMNAPDDMLFDLSNAVDSLGYGYNVIIAGDSSNLSRREYSDIRRVNGGAKDYFEESVNEAYIVTYAKNKGEKPSSVAYKHRDSALAFERDLKKDGYITMLTQRPVDGVDEATKGEENEFHKELDKLVHKTFGHSSDEKKKMEEQIREIIETIKLGQQLDEKKLCKKGQAYRKRRMAAGEKSSAYLSGRAVKVCKGQISGKKKKKKK